MSYGKLKVQTIIIEIRKVRHLTGYFHWSAATIHIRKDKSVLDCISNTADTSLPDSELKLKI